MPHLGREGREIDRGSHRGVGARSSVRSKPALFFALCARNPRLPLPLHGNDALHHREQFRAMKYECPRVSYCLRASSSLLLPRSTRRLVAAVRPATSRLVHRAFSDAACALRRSHTLCARDHHLAENCSRRVSERATGIAIAIGATHKTK